MAEELASRLEIWVEQYFKTVNIEGETTATIARTMILPSAVRYLNDLLAAADRADKLGVDLSGIRQVVDELSALVNEFAKAIDALVKQNAELGGEHVEEKAYHMRDNVIPAMAAVRAVADKLEKIVPDDLWPLPVYRDMLFVK